MTAPTVTPDQIRAIRHALGENTQTFGARFCRSSRTVENWEQGRRTPDPLVLDRLEALAKRQARAAASP